MYKPDYSVVLLLRTHIFKKDLSEKIGQLFFNIHVIYLKDV